MGDAGDAAPSDAACVGVSGVPEKPAFPYNTVLRYQTDVTRVA